jgi:hypothetical protein
MQLTLGATKSVVTSVILLSGMLRRNISLKCQQDITISRPLLMFRAMFASCKLTVFGAIVTAVMEWQCFL